MIILIIASFFSTSSSFNPDYHVHFDGVTDTGDVITFGCFSSHGWSY